jgi:hypothetical protein
LLTLTTWTFPPVPAIAPIVRAYLRITRRRHARNSDYTAQADSAETAGRDATPTESYSNFGLTAWLRLARREETWKTAEILILRHQLAVLQRRQPRRPRLDWADRALLATLLAVIPKARRHGLHLLVTPDTVLRWHRDIVRRRWAARSLRGKTGRPATRRNIKGLVLRLARENPG